MKYIFIATALLFLTIDFAKAEKSDTVTLYNGDRITCEVKSLTNGKLYVKTSDMGKLYIKWTEIAHVETKDKYEITLKDKSIAFGKLTKSEPGLSIIKFGIFEQKVNLLDITSLVQIKETFKQQLSGNFDAGLSYTQGNQNLQFNSSAQLTHRSEKFLNQIHYDGVISITPISESRNQSSGYLFQAYLKNSFFTFLNVTWEQNTELGIENRVLTNAGTGYSLLDNSINRFDIAIGMLLNREYTYEQTSSNNTEGIAYLNYDLFVFTKPDIDISTTLVGYPSFTVKGRFRSTFNFKMRWEIFNNFTLNVKYYYNYDNKPPSVNAIPFDYGINTSVGYTF